MSRRPAFEANSNGKGITPTSMTHEMAKLSHLRCSRRCDKRHRKNVSYVEVMLDGSVRAYDNFFYFRFSDHK